MLNSKELAPNIFWKRGLEEEGGKSAAERKKVRLLKSAEAVERLLFGKHCAFDAADRSTLLKENLPFSLKE